MAATLARAGNTVPSRRQCRDPATPARAGNTQFFRQQGSSSLFNPRSRGEHGYMVGIHVSFYLQPPLAQGTLARSLLRCSHVHFNPRSRGEH